MRPSPGAPTTVRRQAPRRAASRAPCACTMRSNLRSGGARVERVLRGVVAAGGRDRAASSRAAAPRGRATSRAGRAERAARGASTASTSSASRRGPMPRPIGARASVITTSTRRSTALGDRAEQRRRAAPPRPACAPSALGPTGMSISTCVAPTRLLLGQDRGDHLRLGVDLHRPLDGDEDVVGGREIERAAPCDAGAGLRSHDPAHPSGASATSASTPIVSAVPAGLVIARDEVFGHRQAERGEDRHDDHRGAVARERRRRSACRRSDPAPKSKLRAGRDHRAREVDQLVQVERAQRAREHEHRQLDPRVAMLDDVGEDGVEGGAIEAARRAASRARGRRCGGAGASVALTGAPSGRAEVAESVFGEADLVGRDQRVAAEVQHAGDLARVRRSCGSVPTTRTRSSGLKPRLPLATALLMDHDDVLAQRVDAAGASPGTSASLIKSHASAQSQPHLEVARHHCRSIPAPLDSARSASAAGGSPWTT